VPIIGFTVDPKVARKLAMSWGVIPVLTEEFTSMDVMFYHAKSNAVNVLDLHKGDRIVLTGGPLNGKTGNTNTIKVEQI
jgi:pyruvate kinase